MLEIALVFSVMFSVFALLLGGLIGWTINQNTNQRVPYTYHPEMFDENGNMVSDELIAFRFENADYTEEEEEPED
jgi:hypothetical protein